MLVGVALAVPFIVRAVTSVADTVGGTVHETPVRIDDELERGRHVVFERTGTARSTGPVTSRFEGPPAIRPADVVVTGPEGDRVETAVDRANETITRGSAVFTGVVVFDADTAGRYEIEIEREGRDVVIAPSLGQTFRSLGRVFLLALAGGLVFLVGGVLLVVGLVRRSRESRPSPATAPTGS